VTDDRLNVVLITSHDSGRHFGCYGRDVDTPRIDAFAHDGVRFTNHFCPAPQCHPSRASLMTGLYPHRNGMMGHSKLGWTLDDTVRTMPRHLRDAGYSTHVLGVKHLAPEMSAVGYGNEYGGPPARSTTGGSSTGPSMRSLNRPTASGRSS